MPHLKSLSSFIPTFFFILNILPGLSAQQKDQFRESTAEQLTARFKEMVESAILDNSNSDNQPCVLNPEELKGNIHPKIPPHIDFKGHLAHVEYQLNTYFSDDREYTKDQFNTLADKALFASASTHNFADFVKRLTGKDLGDLGGYPLSKEKGVTTTEKRVLRGIYNVLSIYKKPSKEMGALHYITTKTSQGCTLSYSLFMGGDEMNYPKIKWQLGIQGRLECPCEEKGADNLRDATFRYTATTEGVFTLARSSFETLENPSLKIEEISCCPPPLQEEAYLTELPSDTSGTFPAAYDPTSLIGGSFGFEYESGSKSVGLCLGADYLRQLGSTDKAIFLAGAQVQLETQSQGEAQAKYTNTLVSLGPKIEAHMPGANPSVVPYAGLGVNYGFGSSKNENFKDDQTQLSSSLYIGASTVLKNDIGISAQINVLGFDSSTFKNNQGGEFKTNNFFFNLFKHPALKLIVRKLN